MFLCADLFDLCFRRVFGLSMRRLRFSQLNAGRTTWNASVKPLSARTLVQSDY